LVGPLGQSKHQLIDKTSAKPNTVKKRTQPKCIPRAGFKSAILGSVWSKSTCILNSAVTMMLREDPRQCGSRCVLLHSAFRIETWKQMLSQSSGSSGFCSKQVGCGEHVSLWKVTSAVPNSQRWKAVTKIYHHNNKEY